MNNTTQESTFLLYSFPFIISGAIYNIVPVYVFANSFSLFNCFESLKSPILSLFSPVINKLSGFKSLWIKFLLWIDLRPWQILLKNKKLIVHLLIDFFLYVHL